MEGGRERTYRRCRAAPACRIGRRGVVRSRARKHGRSHQAHASLRNRAPLAKHLNHPPRANRGRPAVARLQNRRAPLQLDHVPARRPLREDREPMGASAGAFTPHRARGPVHPLHQGRAEAAGEKRGVLHAHRRRPQRPRLSKSARGKTVARSDVPSAALRRPRRRPRPPLLRRLRSERERRRPAVRDGVSVRAVRRHMSGRRLSSKRVVF